MSGVHRVGESGEANAPAWSLSPGRPPSFFTPSAKGGVGPSYVGPTPRRTTWQRWPALLTDYLGN